MSSPIVELKRHKIEETILSQASPIIESGNYNSLTIRALCSEMGITTGMFYRHFKTKNDLISLYAIQKQAALFKSEPFEDKSLYEKLVSLSLLTMRAYSVIGPDCIFVNVNTENQKCNCAAIRSQYLAQVCDVFQKSLAAEQYDEQQAKDVAEYMIIVQNGICLEWFSRRDEPDFDFMTFSERIIRQAFSAMELPKAN